MEKNKLNILNKIFLVVLFATVLIMDMIKHTVKLLEDTSIMVQESKIQN